MSLCSVLLKAWVSHKVDIVDLMLEDEGENLEEDTSYEEDSSLDKEDPTTERKIVEGNSSKDSS